MNDPKRLCKTCEQKIEEDIWYSVPVELKGMGVSMETYYVHHHVDCYFNRRSEKKKEQEDAISNA